MRVIPNVTVVFPIGTNVGLYAGALFDSGTQAPIGPELDSAVVAADGSLTLEVPQTGDTYALVAQVGGEWRAMKLTTSAPDPTVIDTSALVPKNEGITFVDAGEDLATPRPPDYACVIWRAVGTPEAALESDVVLVVE